VQGGSPSALLQTLLSMGGRELDFKLMDLIPLVVSSAGRRYRQKLLQATVGKSVVVHSSRYYPFEAINLGRPRVDHVLSLKIERSCVDALTSIVKNLDSK
jgi:hypothetical protein